MASAAAAAADEGDDWTATSPSISPLQEAAGTQNAMATVRVVPGVTPGEVAPSPPGQVMAQAFTPMAYMPMMTPGSGQPAAPRAIVGPNMAPTLTNVPASGRTAAGGGHR